MVNDLNAHRYGTVNEDYNNLKITYWKCQLCKAKGVILRKKSTIASHLKSIHKNMTIQQYEKNLENLKATTIACLNPAAALEMRREMENSSKIVEGMAAKTWRCELCQGEAPNASDHVSQQHGMSLAEYVHLLNEGAKNEAFNSNEMIRSEDADGAKPWWDGCIYKCKTCDEDFPDSQVVTKHIYEAHKYWEIKTKEMRYGKPESGPKNRCGTLNKDYEAFKITYWHCKLCALNKRVASGKGIVQRSLISIKAHLRAQHDLSSIEEYEEKVKDPVALREELEKPPSPKPEPRRSLRQNQKSTENFRELATGTTTCKICKKEGIKRLDKHILENHNITSMDEYEEVAMYVPKNASFDPSLDISPIPLLNVTASATTVNQGLKSIEFRQDVQQNFQQITGHSVRLNTLLKITLNSPLKFN